jgi:hypothetical protein
MRDPINLPQLKSAEVIDDRFGKSATIIIAYSGGLEQ